MRRLMQILLVIFSVSVKRSKHIFALLATEEPSLVFLTLAVWLLWINVHNRICREYAQSKYKPTFSRMDRSAASNGNHLKLKALTVVCLLKSSSRPSSCDHADVLSWCWYRLENKDNLSISVRTLHWTPERNLTPRAIRVPPFISNTSSNLPICKKWRCKRKFVKISFSLTVKIQDVNNS